jgi:GTP pyrophosphokinase
LEDEVHKIASLIEQEFAIDLENSGDKGALLDPDRFGYLSLHHVVSLSPERCRLVEYRRFPKLKAEIQTRSILQHAWAEIEHDLGYKSKQEVPSSIRRRFSRLAGLLELADQEFISIRDELDAYEESVRGKIVSASQLVDIDKTSIIAYVSQNELVGNLDSQIAGFCGATIASMEDTVAGHVAKLKFLGVETIGELNVLLTKHSSEVLAFAHDWLGGKQQKILHAGISIFYLCYVLVGETMDRGQIIEYLDTVMPNAHDKPRLVQRIIETSHIIASPPDK